MTHRIIYVAERLLIAVSLAFLLAIAPLPVSTPTMVVNVQIPLLIFLVICYAGKLLIDTLFYKRYP